MNRCTTLFCMLLVTSAASAQDIYFSPADAAPVLLNASYTGMFDGKIRASTLYQNTWRSVTLPYVNYGLSADMPVFTEQNGSYLAAGLQVVRDQIGDGNFNNFYGVVSVAYHKVLSKPHSERSCELALGLQGGYAQKTTDIAKMYFGQEFPSGFFITQQQHLGLGNSINSYTINSGISFSQSTGRKFSYTIGLAGNNLNQPNDAMEKKSNSEVGLDMNYSATFGANWLMAKRFTLRPAVYMCSRASTTNFITGTELQYNFGSGTSHPFVSSVFVGGWFRSGDALTYTAGTQFSNFRIGFGYDMHVGSYSSANGNVGGISLQVRYIAPQKVSTRKRTVPCIRF